MFRITSKVKIAAGIAAGALTLGAAGAYAATANNTITVQNPTAIPLPSNGPTLISVDGKTLTLPTTFANHGACISFFAKNRDFALAPQGTLGTTVKVSKNFHGKLVSGLQAWCDSQVKTSSTTSGTETETPDATESAAPETDSTDSQSGAAHGNSNGHGHGHGHSANETD